MPVTVPPEGTRGVPFPRIVTRLLSPLGPRMFRRHPQKTSGGIPTLLLETRGTKSGKPRYAVLGFLEEGASAAPKYLSKTDRQIPIIRLTERSRAP